MASSEPPPPSRPAAVPLLLGLALAVGIVLGISLLRTARPAGTAPDSGDGATPGSGRAPGGAVPAPGPGRPALSRTPERSPEAIVAHRLATFVRKRREAAAALARRHGVEMPAAIAEFLDAAEAGDWAATQSRYEALMKRFQTDNDPEGTALQSLRPAVTETLGVAEIAATWPAAALIEYGTAVLDAVPAGTVYLGGTEAGRFAPLLFNDAGGADARVILTQNSFADLSYLEYVNLLHGTRIEGLTQEDSTRGFQTYMDDALVRAKHDAEHPEGPRRVRPGEDIKIMPDGRVQVSGEAAVMAINETLLHTLLNRNPDLRFALEESHPFRSFYGDSLPAGPLMELRAGGTDPEAVRKAAAESLEFWKSTAQRLQDGPPLPGDSPVREAWANLAAAQGAYFAGHQLPAEAEVAWRRALEIGPANAKALFGLVQHLSEAGRAPEALQVIDRYLSANPNPTLDAAGLRQAVAGQLPKP